ncbi:GTPase Era [candidate division KSB1 bacterium]|nr:GTPase Era [candidate division KSB1 bacterium]NIR71702.1 GTPase Era [candidate division KSB1 bacterium]NIS28249.1 GTPase Era [candidate division KSB1 bacterium]NIT70379.1 GTPase Era [candidate division KSB1 bacterium]NIU28926.1 GTPase Era [candidate division KSB1 bacterium]
MAQNAEKSFKAGYVAIVGRPNVGKSTLLNNLLNFKVSSVTRKPQTTRHQIRGILNGENYQIVFLDTPGLLEPKYKLENAMLRAVQRALTDADLVLFMVEAASMPDDRDVAFLEGTKQACLLIINKMDRILKKDVLPLMDFFRRFEHIQSMVPISALKLDGLDILKDEIVKALPVGPPFYPPDQITDHPERFVVSEIIREKVFQRYGEEIPYSTTVKVEEFVERKNQKDYIQANIYVEKASQKGILIGKKGAALKQIGKLAREEIEFILGRPVFLELWVKVREKWRQNERTLKEFGYYS